MTRSQDNLSDARISAQFRAAQRTPMLGDGEAENLVRGWREDGDRRALERLVNAYQKLVLSMASKYRGGRVSMGDLVQQGNVGLLEAVQRFDPARNVPFGVVARTWIRSELTYYVIAQQSMVKSLTTQPERELYHALPKLKAKLQPNGGDLTWDNANIIAGRQRVTVDEVLFMELFRKGRDVCLDAPVDLEGGDTHADRLVDHGPDPEYGTVASRMGKTQRAILLSTLQGLSPKEQGIILSLHYKEAERTLAELGDALGIHKSRAHQIARAARCKLKELIADQVECIRDLPALANSRPVARPGRATANIHLTPQ